MITSNKDNPDPYGIRQLEAEMRDLLPVPVPVSKFAKKPAQHPTTWKDEPESLTTREWIAKLIRELTYRELCQISDELRKCDASCLNESDVNMAKILDDWAHMVKDEGEERVGSDDLINMA